MRPILLPLTLLCALPISSIGMGASDSSAFDREIKPLFHHRCVNCHGPATAEGGLNLSNALSIANGGDAGPAIQPRNLAESRIWERVSSHEMPPDEPLSAAELEIIQQWILSGAPGLPAPQPGGMSDRDHWSFRALEVPHLPQVRDGSRVHTNVDRFIQSALEERGLGLGSQADRATLIRRVSFDLTGLPPTLAEISAFLSDSSPNAYRRIVDYYLASPLYGDHWGKRWLEVAGYADSNGYFDADTIRPLAFRYRDYVIRSLNADKPFDKFVREQLAGDELSGYRPDKTPTQEMVDLLEATHFLRNAPDGTAESADNPHDKLRDKHAVLEATVEIFWLGFVRRHPAMCTLSRS
jgi:hypothetical protein